MAKGTIIYVGLFELPDKNAAAHRVMNNGKIFNALGYRTVFLGIVKGESFEGIRKSNYDENVYEEAYPLGAKKWIQHILDTKNIETVAGFYPDTCLVITYNVALATYKAIKKQFAKKDIKVAYDCTEWNVYTSGFLLKRIYKKYDEKQIRTKLQKYCADIIVISSLMERQYKRSNVLRLPPLVDIEDPIWHQDKTEHPDSFEFFFAGTIGDKEKIDSIVKAFVRLEFKNIKLSIIGITKEEYLQMYPNDEEIVDKRICFTSRLSHKENIQHILSSNCYIFVREKTRQNQAGFPTKFAEAYTCGIPIISTDVSDIKEFADEDVALLDSAQEQTVLTSMGMAVEHKKALSRVKTEFDYRNYLNQTEEWILRI